MGEKNSAATAVTSSISSSSTGSSILKSSFTPSSLQLHLFASVIQSFESQRLRVHDTVTGRLRQEHSTKPGTTVASLDWGHYGPSYREAQSLGKRKRKRGHTPEDVVVAYGSSSGEICMFSPAEGRIIGNLTGGHDRGIRDFKFNPHDSFEGWSIGGDGKLVQWDLRSDKAIRTIPLADTSVNVLATPSVDEPRLLFASNTPYSVNSSTVEATPPLSYDAFKHPVHYLQRSTLSSTNSSELFLAADDDRYIRVFNMQEKKIVRTLVAGGGVVNVSFHSPSAQIQSPLQEQMLAVVTRDGLIELFDNPFHQEQAVNGGLITKRKGSSRKSIAQVRLSQSNSKKAASVLAVSLQGPDLVIVSVDGGVEPTFQKLRWQDEGTRELLFTGLKDVVKAKPVSALNSATMNGVKDMGRTHVNESKTVISEGGAELNSQQDAIEISSGDEEEGDESDSEKDPNEQQLVPQVEASDEESDAEMADVTALVRNGEDQSDAEIEDAAQQEPSFGDLLASRHPKTIDITDTFEPERTRDQVISKQLALPSGMSLGTVLTQALRTNDNNLLESCLHANDNGIIQNTIQRLDSGLAAILLSRLAERLASRPGRYGHLLSWVQWTCIAHGGAIAAQPDVSAKIHNLYQVLTQRSKSLDKLLLLKGKLDMLEAQMSFRKQLQQQRVQRGNQGEPGMIYIEGGEDNWSSEDDQDEAAGVPRKLGFKTRRPLRKDLANLVSDNSSSEEDEEDDEGMPLTNGVAAEDSDDEEEDSESESQSTKQGGLIDIEAELGYNSSPGDGIGEDINQDDDEDREDEEDEDDDEEDSEMDSFINDGSISEGSGDELDALDIDEDEEDATPRRPAVKRSKLKHRR